MNQTYYQQNYKSNKKKASSKGKKKNTWEFYIEKANLMKREIKCAACGQAIKNNNAVVCVGNHSLRLILYALEKNTRSESLIRLKILPHSEWYKIKINQPKICWRCANRCSKNYEHRIIFPVSGCYMCFSCEFCYEKKSKG